MLCIFQFGVLTQRREPFSLFHVVAYTLCGRVPPPFPVKVIEHRNYKSSDTILKKKGLKHKKTNAYFGKSHFYFIQYIVYFKHKQINTYFHASLEHKKPFPPIRSLLGWSTEILRYPTSKRDHLFLEGLVVNILGFYTQDMVPSEKTSFRKICDTDPVDQN